MQPYLCVILFMYCILVFQNGETALMLAACGRYSTRIFYAFFMLAARGEHAKIVQALIEAGANVNLRSQVAQFLKLTMHYKQGLVCVVLQDGETALMLAARGGWCETVKALIEAGADITLRNEVGSCNQHFSIIILNYKSPSGPSRDCSYAGCTGWTC